jgi:hypothetical protein
VVHSNDNILIKHPIANGPASYHHNDCSMSQPALLPPWLPRKNSFVLLPSISCFAVKTALLFCFVSSSGQTLAPSQAPEPTLKLACPTRLCALCSSRSLQNALRNCFLFSTNSSLRNAVCNTAFASQSRYGLRPGPRMIWSCCRL